MKEDTINPFVLSDDERKAIDQQMVKPEGELGLKVGRFMDKTNTRLFSLVLAALELYNGGTILELGVGTGSFLKLVSEKISFDTFYGIDHSRLMIDEASSKNKYLVDRKRIKLLEASILNLPFEDECFDVVYTLNSMYFWEPPEKYLKEISRVLKNKGIFINAMRTRNVMKGYPLRQHGFIHYTPSEVVLLVKNARFRIISQVYEPDDMLDAHCVVAKKFF